MGYSPAEEIGHDQSHAQVKDYILPFLDLKTRLRGVFAFCIFFYRPGVPEQALGGIPLGFGTTVEDKPSELNSGCIVQ